VPAGGLLAQPHGTQGEYPLLCGTPGVTSQCITPVALKRLFCNTVLIVIVKYRSQEGWQTEAGNSSNIYKFDSLLTENVLNINYKYQPVQSKVVPVQAVKAHMKSGGVHPLIRNLGTRRKWKDGLMSRPRNPK